MLAQLQEWLSPLIQLAGLGLLWRAAYVLGRIQGSLEVLKETSTVHDTKIDSLETDVATLKGRVGLA